MLLWCPIVMNAKLDKFLVYPIQYAVLTKHLGNPEVQ